MDLDPVIRSFSSWAENSQGKARFSVESQRQDLILLKDYLKEQKTEIEDVDGVFLQGFIDELSLRYAPSTIARLTSTLHSFFGYLNLMYDMPDPSTLLKTPHISRHLPVWASSQEMEAVLADFDQSDKGILDKTIVTVLYCCGLRVSELCTLRANDVRLDQKQIRVLGKGEKERIVPLVDECVQQMALYWNVVRQPKASASSYFFVSLKGLPLNRQYVYRLTKNSALNHQLSPSFSPHSIRHSFATRLIENDTDLRMVQELLGHADISTTQIYTHVDTSRLVGSVDQALKDPGLNFDEFSAGPSSDNVNALNPSLGSRKKSKSEPESDTEIDSQAGQKKQ